MPNMPRRRKRWIGLGLSTFVIGLVSVMGAYHVVFGFDQRDARRVREIAVSTPVQSLPQAIEADLNVRFVPATAARTLVNGIESASLVSRAAEAYVSPDGYIFVTEDMRVAYGRSFVDPRETRAADAITVITKLANDLRQRGIHLIVVPVPAKSSIYPEQADPANPTPHGPLLNKGHHAWFARLREGGVDALDLTDVLWAHRRTDQLFHLADTHWTQRATHIAAGEVAKRIDQLVGSDLKRRSFAHRATSHVMSADVAHHAPGADPTIRERLLCLQGDQDAFRFGSESPVVVLGDSYAEQYESQGGGFAQLLALETGLPVQSAAVRGIPAHAMMGPAYDSNALDQKRVVVLVFSIRKLHVNEWIVR